MSAGQPPDETTTDAADGDADEADAADVEGESLRGPGETTQVRFEVDKQDLGLEPGETFLEVLTRDFGESITVTVEWDE